MGSKKHYIAVVGRPNVGKSTLINRLTHEKKAIVHETSGVTRDRSYHQMSWGGQDLVFIDTGGIEPESSKSAFNREIRAQALAATQEADAILLVVDGACGLVPEDEQVVRILRRTEKPVLLVVNKVDNPARQDMLYDFYACGLGTPLAISALHGTGTGDLLDEIVRELKEHDQNRLQQEQSVSSLEGAQKATPASNLGYAREDTYASGPEEKRGEGKNPQHQEQQGHAPLRIALIGRPNTGKSSLMNRISKTERCIVSDVAGTTRDALDIEVEHEGTTFIFVDTAGLRKKTKVTEDIEYYSYVRGLQAIEEADVCLLLIDAIEGVSEQDQKIARLATDKGAALIVLLNKWDLMKGAAELREKCLASLGRRLEFAKFAPVLRVSALSGHAVFKIWPLIELVAKNRAQKIATSKLNAFLKTLQDTGHTVVSGKAKLRLRYVVQTGFSPPVFTFFCNHPKLVNDGFRRFIENRLREAFDLTGTPILLKFRSKDKE